MSILATTNAPDFGTDNLSNLSRFWRTLASQRRPRTRSEGVVPDGVHSRPNRETVRGERVQTFDAIRHPAGTDSVDLRDVSVSIPIGNVRVVRSEVGGREIGLLGQFGLLGDHKPVRFEGRQSRGRTGVGQVVKGGKRGSVGQARFGGNDRRCATRASRRDSDNVPHRTTELDVHDLEVAVRRGVDGHSVAVSGFAANA